MFFIFGLMKAQLLHPEVLLNSFVHRLSRCHEKLPDFHLAHIPFKVFSGCIYGLLPALLIIFRDLLESLALTTLTSGSYLGVLSITSEDIYLTI